MIVKFNEDEKKARLSLKCESIFKITDDWELKEGSDRMYLWRNEYGAYMIEGTPGMPYGDQQFSFSQFNKVEQNMKNRRKEIQGLLEKDETIISLTSFPR